MDSNALPNILTIGPPESPILTLYNQPQNGNGDAIESVSGVFGVDVIGDTLSIDEIDAVVHYGGPLDTGMDVWEVYLGPSDEVYLDPDGESVYAQLLASAPDGSRGALVDLRALPFGTPVRWTNNGRLIAAFYLKSVDRAGKNLWKITACSGVGLLDKVDHVGGIYTGQTVSAVLSEIIGSAFPYTVAPSLADQQVYGWLPYDTARNNLHQLLFALGAAMRRDANGEAQFVFLDAAAPQSVGNDRISFGGSVFYDTPATRAEVIEHTFFITPEDEEITLFDNTGTGQSIADATPVRFDGPMHDLAVTGTLTYSESGVNYAIVSGTGTLTGKAYTHTMRIVAQDAEGTTGEPNVKHVDDYTLVSLANSVNVSKRVLAYYQAARLVSASVTLDGERCGDVLSLDDPFFDPITAFLESISVNASTTLWGPAKLVENYVPNHQGNNVTGFAALQGTGTWVAPISGDVQYVLLSGAQGGSAGNAGETAIIPTPRSYSTSDGWGGGSKGLVITRDSAKAGSGGSPGNGGAGGRIKRGTITVTEGQGIVWSTGIGGAGEVYGSGVGHGADGTDTVFGSISTAGEEPSAVGFIDPISGNQYGKTGSTGVSGLSGSSYGSSGGSITIDGVTYRAGSKGRGERTSRNQNRGWSLCGGYGGGAAYKANGHNGGDASSSWRPESATGYDGPGGDGANALAPDQESVPGQGGRGGNGGGGGGAFGSGYQTPVANFQYSDEECWIETTWTSGESGGDIYLVCQSPGQGGDGSDGGQGADGIILLYWGGN